MQKIFLKILSNINLKPHQIQKLDLYRQELTYFNQKFSLVSRQAVSRQSVTRKKHPKKHTLEANPVDLASSSTLNHPPLSAGMIALLDSVVAGQLLLKQALLPGPIADIGSGAGFPGLILAVLDPDREFWLYEVNQKKASFLEHIAWKLNLKNIQVKNIPIQEEKPKSLTQGVSKAFFSLPKRLELTKWVFKAKSRYYHLQSLSYKKEWDNKPPHLNRFWALTKEDTYNHPLLSNRILLTTTRLEPKFDNT